LAGSGVKAMTSLAMLSMEDLEYNIISITSKYYNKETIDSMFSMFQIVDLQNVIADSFRKRDMLPHTLVGSFMLNSSNSLSKSCNRGVATWRYARMCA
jgi:hypothetical protein